MLLLDCGDLVSIAQLLLTPILFLFKFIFFHVFIRLFIMCGLRFVFCSFSLRCLALFLELTGYTNGQVIEYMTKIFKSKYTELNADAVSNMIDVVLTSYILQCCPARESSNVPLLGVNKVYVASADAICTLAQSRFSDLLLQRLSTHRDSNPLVQVELVKQSTARLHDPKVVEGMAQAAAKAPDFIDMVVTYFAADSEKMVTIICGIVKGISETQEAHTNNRAWAALEKAIVKWNAFSYSGGSGEYCGVSCRYERLSGDYLLASVEDAIRHALQDLSSAVVGPSIALDLLLPRMFVINFLLTCFEAPMPTAFVQLHDNTTFSNMIILLDTCDAQTAYKTCRDFSILLRLNSPMLDACKHVIVGL